MYIHTTEKKTGARDPAAIIHPTPSPLVKKRASVGSAQTATTRKRGGGKDDVSRQGSSMFF